VFPSRLHRNTTDGTEPLGGDHDLEGGVMELMGRVELSDVSARDEIVDCPFIIGE
jgi:hypothetical protein